MRVSAQAVIAAPPAAVEATLSAPEGVETWDPAVSRSAAAPASGGGLERIVVRTGDGRSRRERRMQPAPEAQVVWEVVDGLRFPLKSLRWEWSVAPDVAGARVTAGADFRLRLPYGPVGGLFWLVQRRRRRGELAAALAGLKARLEAGGLALDPTPSSPRR